MKCKPQFSYHSGTQSYRFAQIDVAPSESGLKILIFPHESPTATQLIKGVTKIYGICGYADMRAGTTLGRRYIYLCKSVALGTTQIR